MRDDALSSINIVLWETSCTGSPRIFHQYCICKLVVCVCVCDRVHVCACVLDR